MTVFFQNPLQFVSVKLRICVWVVAFKKTNKAVNAWQSSCSQYLSDLVNNLVWSLASDTKDRVHIWVVSASFVGDPASEFLEVDLSVTVAVEFVEKSCQFVIVEDTANSFESLFKLLWSNGSIAFQVKMLENVLSSFALIVGSVSALTDLFENNSFNLS